MTEQIKTARERVAEAVHNVNPWWEMYGDPTWPDLPVEMKGNDYERADAAIAAYNAWLWEQAERPEVQDAVARTLAGLDDAECFYRDQAAAAITTTLEALIGSRMEITDDN